MDMLFKFILGIVIIAGLVYFIIALRKKLITPRVVDAKGRQAVNYFIDFKENSKLYIDTFNLEITTIKELENYLELLIPAEDRKFNDPDRRNHYGRR